LRPERTADAGIIYQYIQPGITLANIFGSSFHRRTVGDIETYNTCVDPAGLQLPRGRCPTLLIPASQQDRHTERTELHRDFASDSPVSAGYQGDSPATVNFVGHDNTRSVPLPVVNARTGTFR
jgi:hypothetical protein